MPVYLGYLRFKKSDGRFTKWSFGEEKYRGRLDSISSRWGIAVRDDDNPNEQARTVIHGFLHLALEPDINPFEGPEQGLEERIGALTEVILSMQPILVAHLKKLLADSRGEDYFKFK